MRILRFLWGSRAEWSGREVSRRVELSAPACHEALKKLYAKGLARFRRVSNVHLYKVNPDNYLVRKVFAPLFKAEKSAPEEALKLVKKTLAGGPRRQAIVSIMIFGSMAGGKERLDSDLDLMVVVSDKKSLKTVEPSIEALRESLARRFNIPLSPYVQTLSEIKRKYNQKLPLIRRILKEGRSIYGKGLGELVP